jgi:SAM-dependent methyltransferase
MTQAMVIDGWGGAAAYERYMGRWSRQLAPHFLRWLDLPPGRRWLDLGCGTGALSEAIVAACAPRAVTGVDPSEGFLAVAQKALAAHVQWHRAGADRLPLADGAVDATASLLVLNFVPDTAAALREMTRVTATGGTVAACVWDYAQKMDMIRHYWDTAAELDLLAPGQDQGERFPICRPEVLTDAFAGASLADVDVCALEIEMRFADFDDYWQPFLGGQGSAPAHAVRLAEVQRERLRARIRDRLPIRRDGSILLVARAWAARGTAAA